MYDAEACHLHVANPTGVFLHGPIPHVEPDADGGFARGVSWHWPERV